MLDAVEVLKDRHLHEFGFTVETVPTQDEIADLKEDLAIALKEGTIDVQVKSQAIRIARSNIKYAIEYVAYHRRKTIERNHSMEIKRSEAKSKNDAMAAKSKVIADTQAYSEKKRIDIEYAKEMAKIDVLKKKAFQEIEATEKDREFEEEVFIAKLTAQSDFENKKFLEDRKDDRVNLKDSNSSKLVHQRKNDKEPINFNDDWFKDDNIGTNSSF